MWTIGCLGVSRLRSGRRLMSGPAPVPSPVCPAPVLTDLVPAPSEHSSGIACYPGICRAPVARLSLVVPVFAFRPSPFPSSDVGCPKTLVTYITSVLAADRKALVRAKKALPTAVPLHDRPLPSPRGLARPASPWYLSSASTPRLGSRPCHLYIVDAIIWKMVSGKDPSLKDLTPS